MGGQGTRGLMTDHRLLMTGALVTGPTGRDAFLRTESGDCHT
jgi:hypothetical protein